MADTPISPVSRDAIRATSVLVVGDIMLDRYWFGDVERISPEAPVPIVRVQREEYRLGGAGNVALNIAALGAQVTLLGVVGSDEAGRKLAAMLDEHDIGSELQLDREFPTMVKLRVSGRQQQLLRIDFEQRPGVETLVAMRDDFERLVAIHDVVVMSDYGKGTLSSVEAMIAHARSTGRPVLVDPKGSDYSIYRGATLITPNRGELMLITGKWNNDAELAAKATRLRRDLGLVAILVTRSEEGMSLFDEAGELRVSADAREVFDVTGAGDTVIATVAALVGAGRSVREAIPPANRAGGIVVGRFGTSTVTYDELFASA
jgi:rfaE bifunctional protein kinase chain/domain